MVRRRLLFLSCLLALSLLAIFATGLRCALGTAVKVVDGDTFDMVVDAPINWGDDCALVKGQRYRVRLIGVQAPEASECYGTEASSYLEGLLANKAVCIVRDTSCQDTNGQLLAYVWVDTDPSKPGCELFLNGELVGQGYANVAASPPDTLLSQPLKSSACEAYKAKRGMWGACQGLHRPAGCPLVRLSDQLPVHADDIVLGRDGKYYIPDRGDGCYYVETARGTLDGKEAVSLWAEGCDGGWSYVPATGQVTGMLP
jgi:endonuclease YncB( thermonuclease family)